MAVPHHFDNRLPAHVPSAVALTWAHTREPGAKANVREERRVMLASNAVP